MENGEWRMENGEWRMENYKKMAKLIYREPKLLEALDLVQIVQNV